MEEFSIYLKWFLILISSWRKGSPLRMVYLNRFYFLLLLLALLVLSGCAARSPAATPTTVPTIAIPPTATRAPTATPKAVETAYPYPVEEELPPSYPYPAGEGNTPGGVPVRENRSRVTAKLIGQAPDPDNAGLTRLHVRVTVVEEIAGMLNQVAGLVNTETDFYVHNEIMIDLKPGDTFSAEVSYRGDEHGVKVYVILFDR